MLGCRTGDPDPEPAPEVVPPCARCGGPVTGQDGEDDALFAPLEDGRHCLTCRSGMRQYTTLRGALFGRRSRGR